MDAPESSRSRSGKRDYEEKMDARDGRIEYDEDRKQADKRQHCSSKSRKHDDEEIEDQVSGRRRKSSRSSRAGSGDEGDYDTRIESRSKIPRNNPDEPKSSEGYRGRDYDGIRKNRDDEHERNSSRKTSARPSDHESSQSRSRSKAESYHEGEHEKVQDRDSRYSERKESSSREKSHGQRDEERNHPSRRCDEADTGKKAEESGYTDRYDHHDHGTTRDKTLDPRYESSEAKSRAADLSGEKDVRSGYKEERLVMDSRSEKDGRSGYREEKMADGERSRNRRQSEAYDEHNRMVAQRHEVRSDTVRDDRQRKVCERSVGLVEDAEPSAHLYSIRSPGEKDQKYKQQGGSAYGSRDEVEIRERSIHMVEDGCTGMRDRSGREIRRSNRSRTPERSGWHHRESDEHDRGGFSEYENERRAGIKGKEWEKENYRDYRDERSFKGDSSWNDKNREWDTKDADREFDHVKEWDSQRREQERVVSEMLHSRPGYRRDTRMRLEDVNAPSSFRNINEKSDSIEIKPNKNFDLGREESVSTFHGRRAEVGSQQDFASGANEEEWRYSPEVRGKMAYAYGDDLQERFNDDGSPMNQNSGRNTFDSQAGKGRGQKGAMTSNRTGLGQSASIGPQSPFGNNQGSGSFNRAPHQGPKGGRPARGGRRISGRDVPRVGMPLPLMGPPFGPLGLTSGPMQPIGPNVPHSQVPPIAPGLLIPPFPGPLVWPGARGVDMNMLAVPPNLQPIPPPGPAAPRFAPIMGSAPNHPMYFNHPGPGRGVPPNTSGPGFIAMGPIGHETPHDKAPLGWGMPRNSEPSGKAPSRGEQNDYSQNFVDTGMRPQNFIRELELTSTVEDYPRLRELIQRKDEIVAKSASPPMYYKCDLREFVLTPESFGTKFDVILVDPPWEEYVHRAPGVTDHLEYWSFEEIQNLKIEALADTPSFIFLWVGDGVGLEQGRQCLKKWGFRRCEDICWVKTNKRNATPGLRHDSRTLFQHSKEHCLMGIKGTVRRSTDGHIIHANIDTDIIIAEEPSDGSTKKPEDMYRIIEHFALGRRRLELFGEDHNIRSGWLTLGKGLSSSNFNTESFVRNFADEDGKVWQGGSGRNPPPEAPHLVLTTPEIESLRPKSPPPKNQQQQQSSMPLMTTGSSSNRRPSGNSPQTATPISHSGLNQDASFSEPATSVPWASSPMVGSQGPEGGHGVSDNKFDDGYRFNASCIQAVGDHLEFDPRRAVNMT